MELKDKINTFPKTPGIYMMKDSNGDVIYVGKSKKLQERIKSYFVNSSSRSRKIERLVKNIKDIEIIQTDTELDALLLECEMIKKIRPMYNKLMRNPENYAYLKINKNTEYPYVEVVREINDDSIYFGAYTLGKKLEGIKDTINEVYKIRSCKKMTKCFKYELQKCSGPCRGFVDKDDYNNIINKLITDLNNTNSEVLENLNLQMKAEVENLNFEKALQIKEDIDKLKSLFNKQNIIKNSFEYDNILAWINLECNRYKIYIFKNGLLVHSEIMLCIDFESIDKVEYYYNYFDKTNINESINQEDVLVDKLDIDYVNIIYSYIKYNKDVSYTVIK